MRRASGPIGPPAVTGVRSRGTGREEVASRLLLLFAYDPGRDPEWQNHRYHQHDRSEVHCITPLPVQIAPAAANRTYGGSACTLSPAIPTGHPSLSTPIRFHLLPFPTRPAVAADVVASGHGPFAVRIGTNHGGVRCSRESTKGATLLPAASLLSSPGMRLKSQI